MKGVIQMNQPSREAWKQFYMYCAKNIMPKIPDEKKREYLTKKKTKVS